MRRQRGFTLLEVIIAFALLALALTLLLGSLSGASRQVRAADQSTRAALHGQSLLAQLGVGERLQIGHTEGEFEGGRYRWQLDVAPYVDPVAAAAPLRGANTPELLQLRLVMRWGQGARERMVWDSLRLVPPDPNRGRNVP
ncbi:type II secretion system protein XpsI [Pseudoxanthomonas indica]|uniref:General secretion pathway protein I n=1 Tax=Pseudoxanthomonas indica TaxID=428993 RepID=A0A1T5LF38_9GAMM|nr:prepilin-type N-terminal cleavage/methylation domain-containing protein [Pseudoxanthomonas indica]GGD34510.1 type II secretion system protein I [Pseudoxanthomonas indica]SKC74667.1 general secretion pathway protein I [Pseudoxanthomonas indica]